MFTKKLMVIIVGAALSAGAVVSQAALPGNSNVVAREASEGPRGEGKGHPVIDTKDVIAREASEGPRGEGKGHPVIDTKDVIAREASEGPRGEGKGHPLADIKDVLA